MHVDFQTPFEYDPTVGNLLFEFRSVSSTGSLWIDGHIPGDGDRHLNGSSSPFRDEEARRSHPFSFVREFAIVPEPAFQPTWLVAVLGFAVRRRHRGSQRQFSRRSRQTSAKRGRPHGTASWIESSVKRLGLQSTLRPRGRPQVHFPDQYHNNES